MALKNIFKKNRLFKTSDTKQKYEVQTIEVPFNHLLGCVTVYIYKTC